MIARRRRAASPARFLVPLAAMGAVGVAALMIARANPDSAVQRYVAEVEGFARQLPTRAQRAISDARERFAMAKTAFREARAQSQRVLSSQLEEAKHRGSMPPI